jgi:hypothetical protein
VVPAGAGAKVRPPSDDCRVAPALVRTVILSPMAETRVMAVPRSATGLHHGPAARADALAARRQVTATQTDAVSVSARVRRSEPI